MLFNIEESVHEFLQKQFTAAAFILGRARLGVCGKVIRPAIPGARSREMPALTLVTLFQPSRRYRQLHALFWMSALIASDAPWCCEWLSSWMGILRNLTDKATGRCAARRRHRMPGRSMPAAVINLPLISATFHLGSCFCPTRLLQCYAVIVLPAAASASSDSASVSLRH